MTAAPRRWSAERAALVVDRYAGEPRLETLVAALNALPGPAVTAGQLGHYALRLGLKRAAPSPASRFTPHRTEARTALLLELWPDRRLATGQVLARIHALPGPRFGDRKTFLRWVDALGLPGGARGLGRTPGVRALPGWTAGGMAPPAAAATAAALAEGLTPAQGRALALLQRRGEPDPMHISSTTGVPLRDVYRLAGLARDAARAVTA